MRQSKDHRTRSIEMVWEQLIKHNLMCQITGLVVQDLLEIRERWYGISKGPQDKDD